MATYKCIAKFDLGTNRSGASSGRRIGGWTEGVYSQSSDFAALRVSFEELCRRRANLLPLGATIFGQRYQLIDPTGRTVSTTVIFPGSTWATDVPQMCLNFAVPAASTPNVRNFCLRGLPDTLVKEGEYLPDPDYSFALDVWKAQLAPFRFAASTLSNGPIAINSIAGDGTFVLQQPLTYAANDYLNVSRAKNSGGQSFNGRFWVKVRTDAQNGQFGNWPHGATLGGTVRLDDTIYPLFDSTATITPKVGQRKVGRPLNGYRGRASNRA